jgi:hypothetical protein
MNEKLIDNIIQDYSLRELQICSSGILSLYDATNNFIKQFKADHDSHQFYKNVIKWYVKKHQRFPEDKTVVFKFGVNSPGLGDRFIFTSNLLLTINALSSEMYSRFIVDMYLLKEEDLRPEQSLNFTDFYDVIDFFHFQKPTRPIISNVLNEKWDYPLYEMNYNMKNEVYKEYNRLFKKGIFWPIKYDKTVKKEIITFMFYVPYGKHTVDYLPKKWISAEEEKAFNQLKDHLTNIKFNFVRLEDLNYAKNVELLSQSHLLIASEGMWTHLSRAMNIDTIVYTQSPEFAEEINEQGHFCSGNFEECLTKLKEKCTALP